MISTIDTDGPLTFFFCPHCGLSSEDREDIINHTFDTGHRGVIETPAYDYIEDPWVNWLTHKIQEHVRDIEDRQLQSLYYAVEEELDRRIAKV